MMAHAASLHSFILSKRLNIKLLFLVRHPLTNIRALQSWSGHLTKKQNATATTDLARKCTETLGERHYEPHYERSTYYEFWGLVMNFNDIMH